MPPKSRYFNLLSAFGALDICWMAIGKISIWLLFILGGFLAGYGQWDYPALDHRDYSSPALTGITGELRPAALHPVAACGIKGSGLSMQVSKPGWKTAPVRFDAQSILDTRSGFFIPAIRGEVLSGYRTMRVSLGYARKITEWLDAGMRFNYDLASAAGYRPRSGLFLDAGFVLHFQKHWVADFTALNITLLSMDLPDAFRPPMSIHSGIGCQVSSLAGIGLGLLSIPGGTISVQAHVVYRVHEKVRARLSYTTGANAFKLGIGFIYGRLQCGINFAYMFPLGMTGGLDGQYGWGQGDQ